MYEIMSSSHHYKLTKTNEQVHTLSVLITTVPLNNENIGTLFSIIMRKYSLQQSVSTHAHTHKQSTLS